MTSSVNNWLIYQGITYIPTAPGFKNAATPLHKALTQVWLWCAILCDHRYMYKTDKMSM